MAQTTSVSIFGGDPAGIPDSGSFWNFCYHVFFYRDRWINDYHCVKGGIKEPLAKRIWWRHLANNIALAEVPAGYDCFLVIIVIRRIPSTFLLRNGGARAPVPTVTTMSWQCVPVWPNE